VTVLDWGHHVVVIGEVGQAHDGSLGTAHAFIDAGADAVKFQTHIAAAESLWVPETRPVGCQNVAAGVDLVF
jgi:sialic acid synthase SpsE